MAAKLKFGDVLAIDAPGGVVYVQLIGKHPLYDEAVAVCPRLQAARVQVTEVLFADSYVIFYPASMFVKEGVARVVGRLPAPPFPTRFRRPGARAGDAIRTWLVEEPTGDVVRWSLSDEELQLPIAVMCSTEALIDFVTHEWRPERVGRTPDDTLAASSQGADGASGPAIPVDRPPDELTGSATQVALKQFREHAAADLPAEVRHYLYFPTKRAAQAAAAELKREGFRSKLEGQPTVRTG